MNLEKLRDIIGRRSKKRFAVPKSEDECNHVVALSSDDDIVAYIALSNCADALLDVVEAVKALEGTIYVADSNGIQRIMAALARLEAVE